MKVFTFLLAFGLGALVSCGRASALGCPPGGECAIQAQVTACRQLIEKDARYQQAAESCAHAVSEAEKSLGSRHALTAEALSQLGRVRYFLDDFSAAEKLHRQALDIFSALYGPDHVDVGTVQYRLGALYHAVGQYALSEEYYRRALSAWRKHYGRNHPQIAQGHNNLGVLYAQQSRYDDAEREHREALAIRQAVLPAVPTDLAQSYHNLADLAWPQGKFAEGKQLAEKALAIRTQIHPPLHPRIASTLGCLANFYWAEGDYDRAQALNQQALDIYEKTTGPLSQEAGWSLRSLAQIELSRRQTTTALKRLDRWLRIGELLLGASQSGPQAAALLQRLSEGAQWVYARLPDPAAARLALRTSLLMKGRSIDLGASAQRGLRSSLIDPTQKQRVAEWEELRRQLLKLELSRTEREVAPYEREHRGLALRVEEVEHLLAAHGGGALAAQVPSPDEAITKVASRLPSDGALLEVLWARPYDFETRGLRDEQRWRAPRYFALLLFPSGTIEVRDLGDAAKVDAQARRLLEALRTRSADWLTPAQVLYQSVLAPFSKPLTAVRKLYVSLDGVLNLVPLDALHDGRRGLLERFDSLVYLTSGRDLLRRSTGLATTPPVVIADPDFAYDTGGGSLTAGTLAPAHSVAGLYERSQNAASLPGTAVEAEYIRQLRPDAKLLLREASTESKVRELRSPQFLVFATHGVFLAQQGPEPLFSGAAADLDRSRGLARPVARHQPSEAAPRAQGDPMSDSALLLAGAARAVSGMDPALDGHLLAEEARLLDLSGTALVVLSACDTGVGAIQTSQGVVGLRRAFQVAGAEALVTSLWRIDDVGTSELMRAFWKRVLHGGPRLGALRQAMREVKRSRSHPYFWAPFIGIGLDTALPSQNSE